MLLIAAITLWTVGSILPLDILCTRPMKSAPAVLALVFWAQLASREIAVITKDAWSGCSIHVFLNGCHITCSNNKNIPQKEEKMKVWHSQGCDASREDTRQKTESDWLVASYVVGRKLGFFEEEFRGFVFATYP